MSHEITTIDLSDVELHDENTSGQTEELQEFDLGEIVSTEDGDGIIAAFVEESFEFPVGQSEGQIEEVEEEEQPEMEEIEASEDDPMYIVALQDGGSVAVSADEIDSGGSLDGDGKDIEEWPPEESGDAELAPVYERCDDPSDLAELREAKADLIRERQAGHLADYVESGEKSLEEMQTASYEELVNIRGVDDPHVGFDSLPDGWTRKSVLQAWASLGGMWRTCFARMVREMGPNFAKRWCAAMKDEVLRTEEWRGKF
jgi:hypothetical protein